jgi:chromosomal replication initiator protein
MIAARLLTETEARAHDRRRAFHEKIAAHAAALAAPKEPPAPAAIEPEVVAAETDPPATPMSSREWFWPVEAEAFPKIRKIQEVVGRYYGVTRADLMSIRRMKELVRPRHVAIYLAKQLTAESLPAIGRRFGGRDHTTCLYALRKIERLALRDVETAHDVATLVDALTDGVGF